MERPLHLLRLPHQRTLHPRQTVQAKLRSRASGLRHGLLQELARERRLLLRLQPRSLGSPGSHGGLQQRPPQQRAVGDREQQVRLGAQVPERQLQPELGGGRGDSPAVHRRLLVPDRERKVRR